MFNNFVTPLVTIEQTDRKTWSILVDGMIVESGYADRAAALQARARLVFEMDLTQQVHDLNVNSVLRNLEN